MYACSACALRKGETEFDTHNIGTDNGINSRRISAAVPVALELRSPPQPPRHNAVIADAIEPQILAHAFDDPVLTIRGRHAGGI